MFDQAAVKDGSWFRCLASLKLIIFNISDSRKQASFMRSCTRVPKTTQEIVAWRSEIHHFIVFFFKSTCTRFVLDFAAVFLLILLWSYVVILHWGVVNWYYLPFLLEFVLNRVSTVWRELSVIINIFNWYLGRDWAQRTRRMRKCL